MAGQYLINDETLTSMADKIRILNGIEGALTTAQMDSNLGEANTEVSEQAELIEQIIGALEGKVSGGSAEPILQDKTVTPSTSKQTVTADSGYDGLDIVTVNAIPSQYITTTDATATASDVLSGKTAYVNGTKITGNIVTKTASNLSASGKTVTVPAGYYASQVTKDVATATQATPSVSIDSAGLITATATQTAGYVAAGTKSGTKQLTVQAAKTVTPTTSNQTAVASGRYTTGAITVAGDANLVAANIAAGKTIFGVTGTHEGLESTTQETWVITLKDGSVVEKVVCLV